MSNMMNRDQSDMSSNRSAANTSTGSNRAPNAGQFKKGDSRTKEAGRKGGEASRGGGRNS